MNVDVLVGLAMVVGLIGILLPFLPGLPVIVIAAFVWVVADGSDPGQWIVFAVVTLIAVSAMVIGSVIPARRASGAGASGWVLIAGAIGLVVGAIMIPFVGALIGWPVGVFVGDWVRSRDATVAWATTRATIAGIGLGIGIQFGAGLVAVTIWAIAAWRW